VRHDGRGAEREQRVGVDIHRHEVGDVMHERRGGANALDIVPEQGRSIVGVAQTSIIAQVRAAGVVVWQPIVAAGGLSGRHSRLAFGHSRRSVSAILGFGRPRRGAGFSRPQPAERISPTFYGFVCNTAAVASVVVWGRALQPDFLRPRLQPGWRWRRAVMNLIGDFLRLRLLLKPEKFFAYRKTAA